MSKGTSSATDNGPHYTDEEIIAALRRAAEHEGSPLAADHYDAFEAQHGGPSSIRIIQRFETWNAACTAAGLEVNPSHGSYTKKWTPQEMLEHVADYLALGGSSSIRGYEKYASATEHAPSSQTVRNEFGKWSVIKARAKAVLNTRPGG